jgi:hypothetical protein
MGRIAEGGPCVAEPREMCDHICLKDAEHVQRGEPHFYGYEHPSPRQPVQPPQRVSQERIERLTEWIELLGALGAQEAADDVLEALQDLERATGEFAAIARMML